MCEPCGEKNFIKVHEPQKYQMIWLGHYELFVIVMP